VSAAARPRMTDRSPQVRDEPTEPALRDQTIGGFLGKLAAKTPAPGGGAVAALHAAQAAALIGMVARYSVGPRYEAAAQTIERVRGESDLLRAESTNLIDADAAAFGSVAAAYALPRDTADQKAARSAAIAAALITAAGPPAAVIAAADRLLGLAEALVTAGNRSVLSDVAAAAESIRAAAATARINVEVNLAGITDAAAREEYSQIAAGVEPLLARADAVTAAVRAEVCQ
jgi:methenyltetrahydrofolate cyclohydrolase